jgi:hypothetical protein
MNNSLLSFHPVFPVSFIIAVALALFLFFAFKEFQRRQKFLALRIVALSFMMISLLGLFLRPFYQQEKKSEAIIFLTKGYQSSKVDSIAQRNPELKIIRTTDATPISNSSVLKSWYELSDKNILFVIGQGIPSHALELIQNKRFQFIPSSLPNGVIKLIIPDNIYVNNRQQIQGIFNAKAKTKLKLLGPGGVEDSVALDTGKNSFTLAFTPKQPGKFIYSFVSESSNGSDTDRLPIEILPERRLNLLFIQKFPTAEVRFFKNFLVEKHHGVTLRYQTSKNNFFFEYSNSSRIRIDGLRSELLKSYDLLFIDHQSYEELSASEKNDLKKSVNKGLGIIFQLNNPKSKVLNEFLPVNKIIDSKDTAHIHLATSHFHVLPVLPIEWKNVASVIPVTKNKNRVFSGYFFSGLGKVGFQLIQETYRLAVAGNANDYSSLWTSLISKTAREKQSNFKLKLTTPFPYYSNEPIDITIVSTGSHPSLYADSVQIVVKENVRVEDSWMGKNWANRSGWHQLNIKQDSTQLNYFVSDSSEWKTLRISNQMFDNLVFQNSSVNKIKELAEQVPVSPLLFFFIFLFSSAFLWLAPKI